MPFPRWVRSAVCLAVPLKSIKALVSPRAHRVVIILVHVDSGANGRELTKAECDLLQMKCGICG